MKTIVIGFLLLGSCFANNETTFKITSKLAAPIDSVKISINDYTRQIKNIENGRDYIIKIDHDSIDLINHDFTISALFYYNGQKLPKYAEYYSDLTGTPSENYFIEISDAGKVQIRLK